MQYKTLESGIAVPYHFTRKPKRPRAFEFFAGAGGFGLGFLQAGWEIVGANEFDAAASLTYMTNLCSYPVQIHYIDKDDKERLNKACERYIFGKKKKSDELNFSKDEVSEMNTPFGLYNKATGSKFAGSGWIRHQKDVPPVRNFWFGDVRNLKGKDILNALGIVEGELDCVCGGPPCQGYSRAGKQDVADPRNNLVYEYARLIVVLQPKTFVMEEVPDIINFMDPDGIPVLDKFCMLLQDGGYGRWEMLKKSLTAQVDAACIKSRPQTKKESPKQPEAEQISLF